MTNNYFLIFTVLSFLAVVLLSIRLFKISREKRRPNNKEKAKIKLMALSIALSELLISLIFCYKNDGSAESKRDFWRFRVGDFHKFLIKNNIQRIMIKYQKKYSYYEKEIVSLITHNVIPFADFNSNSKSSLSIFIALMNGSMPYSGDWSHINFINEYLGKLIPSLMDKLNKLNGEIEKIKLE